MRATAGVIIKAGDLLLVVRGRPKGHWSFPKGSVEENETVKEAAIRECKEEVGILVNLDAAPEYKFGSDTLFLVNVRSVFRVRNIDTRELTGYRWVPPSRLLRMKINHGIRSYLRLLEES